MDIVYPCSHYVYQMDRTNVDIHTHMNIHKPCQTKTVHQQQSTIRRHCLSILTIHYNNLSSEHYHPHTMDYLVNNAPPYQKQYPFSILRTTTFIIHFHRQQQWYDQIKLPTSLQNTHNNLSSDNSHLKPNHSFQFSKSTETHTLDNEYYFNDRRKAFHLINDFLIDWCLLIRINHKIRSEFWLNNNNDKT